MAKPKNKIDVKIKSDSPVNLKQKTYVCAVTGEDFLGYGGMKYPISVRGWNKLTDAQKKALNDGKPLEEVIG